MIQQRTCPRCAIRRTVQKGQWGLVCMNCRWRSFGGDSVAEHVPSTWRFTPAELRRLEMYRAAVQAGFYTDTL
jgi:hypothetical protein